jgi:hypothetical protein
MRIAPLKTQESDHLQHHTNLGRSFTARKMLKSEPDILNNPQMREKGILLKDHSDTTAFGRYEHAGC